MSNPSALARAATKGAAAEIAPDPAVLFEHAVTALENLHTAVESTSSSMSEAEYECIRLRSITLLEAVDNLVTRIWSHRTLSPRISAGSLHALVEGAMFGFQIAKSAHARRHLADLARDLHVAHEAHSFPAPRKGALQDRLAAIKATNLEAIAELTSETTQQTPTPLREGINWRSMGTEQAAGR